MKSSDEGIHAAALGGIWQMAIFGFGGVRMVGGRLRISPLLPDEWELLDFYIWWRGQRLHVTVDRRHVNVENMTAEKPVQVQIYETVYEMKDHVSVLYRA